MIPRVGRLHPRLLLAAALVTVVMVPVTLLVASIGIAVLQLSGGAARDTSLVIFVAAAVVADFWGGGIVAALTRAPAPRVAAAWTCARLVVLVLVALMARPLLPLVPVQLLLAVPAAWAGARTVRKQASLRRASNACSERVGRA